MNGSLEHLDQPDPDSIKMFVGQIPRSWSETELKELFEPFGAVHQINILRDRTQNPPQSKGRVSTWNYFGDCWKTLVNTMFQIFLNVQSDIGNGFLFNSKHTFLTKWSNSYSYVIAWLLHPSICWLPSWGWKHRETWTIIWPLLSSVSLAFSGHTTQKPVIATSSTITFQHSPLRQCTALLVCTCNTAVFAPKDEMIQYSLFWG